MHFLGQERGRRTPLQITLGLKLSVPRFQSHSQKFFQSRNQDIFGDDDQRENTRCTCSSMLAPGPSKLSLCPCAHCVCLPFANVLFPCATFRAPVVCHQLMQLLRTVFSCVATHRFGRCFDAHRREEGQRAPENCSHDGWVPFGSHHNRADSTRASMSVTCNVYVLTRSKKTLSTETCVKNDASDHLAMAHGDAKIPEEKSPKRCGSALPVVC